MNQHTPTSQVPALDSDVGLAGPLATRGPSQMSKPATRQLLAESGWRQILPSVLVLAALAVVGYAGHRNGWKVPKFSALFGVSRAADAEWCNEHNVPEVECIACHA